MLGARLRSAVGGGVAIADNFNRASGALGTTSDGLGVWTTLQGTIVVGAGNLAQVTSTLANHPVAGVDVGSADVRVQADLRAGGALYFRVVDANNWWRLAYYAVLQTSYCSIYQYDGGAAWDGTNCSGATYSGGCGGCSGSCYDCYICYCNQTWNVCSSYACGSYYTYELIVEKRVAGTISTVGSVFGGASSPVVTPKVETFGTSIRCYSHFSNPSPWQTVTSTDHQVATKHGIGGRNSDYNDAYIDNWSATPIAA